MAVCSSANGASAGDRPLSNRDRIIALIDRFDSLKTEDLAFVRVATGSWLRYDDGTPENRYRFGFLEDGGKPTFTVRYLDLTRETLKATPEGTPEHERVGHEPWDIAQYARDVAKGLAEPDDWGPGYYMSPSAPLGPRAEALLLARACARRGLKKEVEELFDAIGSLKEALSDLADGFRVLLAMEFADPTLTRADLLERHQRWLDAFPEDWSRKYVIERTKLLREMVAEDRARKERVAQEKPTKEEGIADLLFSLRDELHPVKDWFVDGYFVATTAEKPEGGSRPSDGLRKLGYDAVPALVEAITDQTLTRTVWYSSRHGGSFWIRPVGTFASELLEEESGLRFYGDDKERQAKWRSWWKTVSEKGEETALAEIAARGDSASERAAKKLLERWPGRAEDVIQGIRRATNRHYRRDLVKIVSEVKAKSVTEFLLEELKKGPYVGARVDAARALLDRGRPDGLEMFVKEWATVANPRQKRQPGVPETVRDFDFAIAQNAARQQMAEFLLASGDLEAARTVRRGLMSRSVSVRIAVLESLDRETLAGALERAKPGARDLLEREFERMLGELLEDNHRRQGSFGFSYGDGFVTLRDPLVADLAACQLHELWPHRYIYNPKGPTELRKRRLAEVKNVWRKEFGLNPVEVPRGPDVRSKDPEIAKILEHLLEAGERERKRSVAQLEAVGLGALPWVEDRLRELPEDHPARQDLLALADRLSILVREAALETGRWEAPKELKNKLTSLKGKRLTSEVLIELVIGAIQSLPSGTGDVHLVADRLGDGSGITVSLRLEPARGDRGASVDSALSVMADDQSLHGSFGSGGRTAYDSADDYEDFRKAVDRVIATARDKTFEVLVELRVQ
jgi:hypothetical protein